MLSRLRTALLALALILGTAGVGYGLWQGRTASQRLVEIAKLSDTLRAKEAALKAANASARVLASRLAAEQQLTKEKVAHDGLDKEALATVPEWADTPLPPAIRERLLAY